MSSTVPQDDSYDRYVRTEWALLSGDPARFASARAAVAGLQVNRVLDVECGAEQELRPFMRDGARLGVGIDVSPDVGKAGRELFARDEPGTRVAFARAAAEHLPFAASTFDVVVCRIALPYTDNAEAIAELARVLRPDGALLLKFHHARFYLLELRQALATRRIKPAIHACRVLLAGCLYHVFGAQPRGWVTGAETFQTLWLLGRELARQGLEMRRMLGDSVPAAPSVLVMRRLQARSGTGANTFRP